MPTFNAGDINATLTLDRTPFQRAMDSAIRQGRDFAKEIFKATLDLNTRPFEQKLAAARARGLQFSQGRYVAQLDADRSRLTRSIISAEAELRRLAGKSYDTNLRIDTSGIRSQLRGVERDADTTARRVGHSFASIRLGAIFAGVTVGAGAISPVVIGLAAALGTLGVSALGVGAALKAYSADQKAAAAASASGTSSAVSDAIALRSAMEAIDDARVQQGRVAQDNARKIERASQDVIDAELDVQRATLKTAEARKEATRALEDQIAKVQGFALDQESASIAIARAIENEQKVNADSLSTELDKREAHLRTQEAQARLVELQRQYTRDAADLNEMQAAGIEGSKQVVSAKEAETQANQRLTRAQEDLADAQVQADRARSDAAKAVDRAMQSLADTQAKQAASMDTATKKSNEFRAAMEKLTPAGQDFVKQLITTKTLLESLGRTGQQNLFPGWTNALKAFNAMSPTVNRGIQNMGGYLSDVGDYAAYVMRQPLFQGEMGAAIENTQPIIKSVGNGLIDLLKDFTEFGATARPVTEGLASLIDSTLDGFEEFFDEVSSKSVSTGNFLASMGRIIEDIFGGIGTFLGQIGSAWSNSSSEIESTVEAIKKTFLEFSESGLGSFSEGLKIGLDLLKVLLDILGPFSGTLGGLVGTLAAVTVGWKLLAYPVTKIIELFAKFAPGTIAGKLTSSIASVSTLGVVVGKTNGQLEASDKSTGRFASGAARVGNAAVSAAKYIPLIGIAVAATSEALDDAIGSADELAVKFMEGGEAAEEARAKIKDHEKSIWDGTAANVIWGASQADVTKKIDELRNKMSPLERAQTDVTQAQNDLNLAQKRFGENSPQYIAAAGKLEGAVENLRDAQWEAERATRSHTEKIRDQQNLMLGVADRTLGYQQSLLNAKEAQKALNEATAQYSADSPEVAEAQNRYAQALLDTVTAAGSLSDAQTANLSPSQQMAAHNEAINRQLVILATNAGTTLPPVLQEMVNKLDDSATAAYGVTVKTDQLGNKILTLPPGKTLLFPTDADNSKARIDGLTNSVKGLASAYDTWMDSYLGLLKTILNNPVPVAPAGAPPLLNFGVLSGRAEGGPITAGVPYWVGEKGPELIFPTQAGFVATASQSRDIANRVNNTAAPAPSISTSATATVQLGDLIAALEQVFGGLSLEINGLSLETGILRAEKRRKTR